MSISEIKTYMGGIIKIKKTEEYTKIYLMNIQVFYKKNKIIRIVEKPYDYSSFLYYSELAKHIHPLVFSKYKNVNQGKKVVLFACGPSAKKFKKIADAKYLAVNGAFFEKSIEFDYIFIHDRIVLDWDYESFKNYKADKFCAYHTNPSGSVQLNTSTETLVDIGAQRFFLSDPWSPKLDDNVPDVINPDIANGLFYDRGGGTVFSALQFLLYTHPKEIYLVGCDCTSDGHFYADQTNIENYNGNYLLPDTIKLWKECASIIKILYPDIEVISVNPVNLKGVFKDIYTD